MNHAGDYTKKKFLVIDDFPEFRSSIKKMVESFGGVDIEASSNGEDAIEKMEKTKFDIILSDYNLGGEGKDGQQVLEEAKHRNLLKTSTIYIMLTAESTIKMVMGALEYEPDGYLTKPFNKVMLLQRLEKIMAKKSLMIDIHKAIDRGKISEAIKLCDQEIKKKSKIMIDCLKIKARLFLDEARYVEAGKIYGQVLAVKKIPWAMMGKGKCLYFQEEYYEAAEVFQELIDENNVCVEGYDWLARCKDKLGDPEEAQDILEQAIKLSPKAILRQQELAKYAQENGNLDVAEKALRTAVGLGKYSVHRDADNSLGLANVLLEKLTPDAGIKGKRAGNEALQVLKEVVRANPKDQVIASQAAMLETQAHSGLKAEAEAKKALLRAEKAFNHLGEEPPAKVAIQMAMTYTQMGAQDKAESVAGQVAVKHFEDEQLAETIEEMAATVGVDVDSLIAAEKEKLENLNHHGKELFEQGKLQEAAEYFEKALQENPNNVGILLNCAQALIELMVQQGKDSKLLNRSKKCLDKCKTLHQEDKRFKRYKELCRRHEELVKTK